MMMNKSGQGTLEFSVFMFLLISTGFLAGFLSTTLLFMFLNG